MKKIFLITCIVLCTAALQAQPGTISLNLDGGYTFGDNVNFDLASANVEAAFQYGGGIEYFSDFNKSFELKYSRMDTHMPLYDRSGDPFNEDNPNPKGAVNYILAGGNNYFGNDPDAKARPYFGLGLGVGWLNVDGNSSTAKFAWDAKLGVKIKTSSVVSIKLQAYLQSIVSTWGSDAYYSYYGTVYYAPDYVTLWQFGLGGVLCFDFKR